MDLLCKNLERQKKMKLNNKRCQVQCVCLCVSISLESFLNPFIMINLLSQLDRYRGTENLYSNIVINLGVFHFKWDNDLNSKLMNCPHNLGCTHPDLWRSTQTLLRARKILQH